MFCIMCRAENPDSGHYCWKCSAELVGPSHRPASTRVRESTTAAAIEGDTAAPETGKAIEIAPVAPPSQPKEPAKDEHPPAEPSGTSVCPPNPRLFSERELPRSGRGGPGVVGDTRLNSPEASRAPEKTEAETAVEKAGNVSGLIAIVNFILAFVIFEINAAMVVAAVGGLVLNMFLAWALLEKASRTAAVLLLPYYTINAIGWAILLYSSPALSWLKGGKNVIVLWLVIGVYTAARGIWGTFAYHKLHRKVR